MKHYPFKGFDWIELSKFFKLKEYEKDPDDASELIDFLFGIANRFDKKSEYHKEVRNVCITFISKMIEINTLPGVPIFRGLLELENAMFLRHFALLIPAMCG